MRPPVLRRARLRPGVMAIVVLLALALAAPAVADEDGPDDTADLLVTCLDGEATITGYSGAGGEVVIPAEIDDPDHGTCQVVAIGAYAFDGLGSTERAVTSVRIPDAVTVVGDRAFRDAGLTELIIGADSQLEIIDVGAFAHNPLTVVAIPVRVTEIRNFAFTGSALSELTFAADSALTTIGTEAFDAARLTEISFPAALESIGSNAFRHNGLHSVGFLGPVPSIHATAFAIPRRDEADFLGWYLDRYYINALDGFPIRITVPRTLYGLWSDTDLPDLITECTDGEATIVHYRGSDRHVAVPDEIDGCTVTAIGYGAFDPWARDTTLTGVELPATLTRIDDLAFRGNDLTQVDFPEALTHIGASAFASNALTELDLPDSLRDIGDYAFRANRIVRVAFGTSPDSAQLTAIGEGAFEGDWNVPHQGNQIEHLVFPAALHTIADGAFAYNGLRSVAFNGSDITVAAGAFVPQDRSRPLFGSIFVHIPWYGWHTLPIGGHGVDPFPGHIDAPTTYFSRWFDSPDSWNASVGIAAADTAPEAPVTGQAYEVEVEVSLTPAGYDLTDAPVQLWGQADGGPAVLLGTTVLGAEQTASATVRLEAAGPWQLWARYAGDEDDGIPEAVSDELTVEVARAASVVSSVVEPAVVDALSAGSVEIEVVAVAPGGGVPTGVVTAILREPAADDDEPLIRWESHPVALIDGAADLAVPVMPAGDYEVVVRYSGTDDYEPAEADPAPYRVTRVPSEISVIAPEAPSTVGTPMRWQVTVGPDSAPAIGVVDIRYADDGTGKVLASAMALGGPVELTVDDLPVGDHELVAGYRGSAIMEPVTSSIVHAEVVPAVTVTEVSAPEEQGASAPITVSATVDTHAADGTVPGWQQFAATGEVEFEIDGLPIGDPVALAPAGEGETATAHAEITVPGLDPGEYEVLAQYTGDDRALASSASSVLVVVADGDSVPGTGAGDTTPATGPGETIPATGSGGILPATGSGGGRLLVAIAATLMVTGMVTAARGVTRGRDHLM